MARRLSAMFSLSKDTKDDHINPHIPVNGSPHFEPSSPTLSHGLSSPGRLFKKQPMDKTPSLLDLAAIPGSPLPPPPLVTEFGVRPASKDGQPRSRTGSLSGMDSSDGGSRPHTPTSLGVPGSPSQHSPAGGKLSKRRSWLPGKTNPRNSHEPEIPADPSQAWIAGLKEHVPYDMTPLLRGEQVSELWDDTGDVVVYLFPQTSRRGPSFKLPSTLFADSQTLNYLCPSSPRSYKIGSTPAPQLPELSAMGSLNINDRFSTPMQQRHSQHQGVKNFSTPNVYPPTRREQAVHLPLELEGNYDVPGSVPSRDDLELIVLYRNFFAFLCGGALISTPRQNSLFSIFMGISSILRRLQFGNDKGSSWGAVPWASFSRYTDELRLADVRASREKNIEAIVLGEAMRSWPLYNEGFVHAAGRLEDVKSIKSPKYGKISPITVNRLERANLDLQTRLLIVHSKLDNFDFASMFAGIANSQTATEARLVRFKAWKAAFLDFRAFTLAQYKRRYGAWPPKASSKKNNFEESGLNRALLQEMYKDFTDLYEILVDRTNLTTRTVDDMPSLADDATAGASETIQHALRSVMSEYDRSTPPVTPPVPFDVPQIPALASSFSRDHVLAGRDPQAAKKLRDNEINALLLGSYNRDSIKPTTFCQDFLSYERKLGQGKTLQDLVDYRCGQWLFMYAVLQALPMTVVDARDLKYTEGVEYFLCMAPRGGRPWMKEDTSVSRAWYNVASGGGMVSLPADLIDHSVEGIYRRSHVWEVANKWAEALPQSPVVKRKELPSTVGMQPPPAPFHVPQPRVPSRDVSPFLAPVASNVSGRPSPQVSPLLAPTPSYGEPGNLALPGSGSRPSSRTSMHIGLHELNGPVQEPARPVSVYNPNITFDAILGSTQPTGKKGKKDKKR